MKRRHLNTIFMCVALVGLMLWYFIYEKNVRVTSEGKEETKKQLISIPKDDIQEVTIEKVNAEGGPLEKTVQIKRVGKTWTMTYPVDYPADEIGANAMATTLATTKFEGVVEEHAKDLEKYGLKNPRLVITIVKDSKSPVEQIQFGGDTPVGGAVYVKTKASDTVYRVTSYVRSSLDKPPKDVRERAIFNIARADLSELEVVNTKGTILLAKGEKEQWSLPRENLLADVNEANRFINAILEARAIDFVDGKVDLNKYGLSNPKIKIVLTKATDKTKTSLIMGQVGDKFYSKRADKDVIFETSKDLWGKVDVTPSTLRTKEVASFSRSDIRRIKLERGKETLELFRANADWDVPEELSSKIDPLKVDNWLTTLQDLKVEQYADRKGRLPSVRMTIRLMEKKDKQEVEKLVLRIGPTRGGLIGIERQGFDMVFFIKENDFKKLDLKKTDFLKSEKPSEPGEPIKSEKAS